MSKKEIIGKGILGPRGLRGHRGLRSLRGLRGILGLLGLLGLLCLVASCSKEETVGNPAVVEVPEAEKVIPDTIAFSPNLTEHQTVTRADVLEDKLPDDKKTFMVWGYKNDAYDEGTSSFTSYQTVMDGYHVEWTANTAGTTITNTHDWEYLLISKPDQGVKFWDWSAKAYRFFAVAPATVYEDDPDPDKFGLDGSGDNYTITLPADAEIEASDAAVEDKIVATPYYSRLWFSTGNTVAYPTRQFGKPVVLEFIKPLARVRFMFIYVYPREGITLENKCFKASADYIGSPVGIARKGTVTMSFPLKGAETKESTSSVTPDGSNPKALVAFTEDYDPEDYSKEYPITGDGWYIVLPNTTQGSYKLSVDVNKTTRYAEVPAEYMHWKSGYQYTYIFKIMEEGGVEFDLVSSAFTPWTELNLTHELYNW